MNHYNRYRDLIERWLSAGDFNQLGSLAEPARYSLLSPGKRLRGSLALAVGEGLGIPSEKLRPLALSVECLHASTLVHDDLPGLDNDLLRRGLPTTHAKFGVGVAVLAGDALYALSVKELLTAEVPVGRLRELVERLSNTYLEVCDGQVLDLQAHGTTLREIEERHRKKTGALFAFAASAPVSFLEDREQEPLRNAFSQFGEELGMLFQVQDDIQDVTSNVDKLGKNPGQDAQTGRVTFVTALGLEGARKRVEEGLNKIDKHLVSLGELASGVRAIVEIISRR